MKLYISDLDGTLLNNQMCLSDETISILNPHCIIKCNQAKNKNAS